MGQFTPEGLARLLANVEREVLVEALQVAELSQLLTSDTIKTVGKLGRALESLDEFNRVDTKEGFLSFIPDAAFGLEAVLNFWKVVLGELGVIDEVKGSVAELKALLGGGEIGIPQFVITFINNKLNTLEFFAGLIGDVASTRAGADFNRIDAWNNLILSSSNDLRKFLASSSVSVTP